MADILLVHGSSHGAWCWRDVTAPLASLGHRARTIDLPGHGDNPTAVSEVTLNAYARAIIDACDLDTVLVGHSMGGYAITAAAALDPARVSRLVYLCAYVPQAGLTLAQMRMMAPRQPLLEAIEMSPDGLSFTIRSDKARAVFYHDCSDADAAFAEARLCPQAVAPSQAVVDITANLAALPRRYIRCLDDRAVPSEYQITMTDGWPAVHVQDLPGGHSPFFADPQALAACIDRAVES